MARSVNTKSKKSTNRKSTEPKSSPKKVEAKPLEQSVATYKATAERSNSSDGVSMIKATVLANKWPLLLLFVILLGFIAYKNKQFLVAATVNGDPVWRSTLNQKLVDRYGENTLDAIVGEKLIQQEAQKKGITVADKEITDRVEKMKKQLPAGMSLADALKMQGMNEKDFRSQLATSLLVDKLLSSQATVSGEQIEQFLKDQGNTLSATDEAERRKEAEDALKQQKTQEVFQNWYQDLRKKANIQKYL